ncbi:tetratricopeptide repeat protein [Lewinellaceae bacterium SD302]|nr:tetratricopeptide repeat protein [Lewinellaceae bacterium SD302]
MSKMATIQSMLEANPKDSFLRFALAKEYEKLGEDQKVKEIYQAILADDPDYVGTYYHLGKTLERLGEEAAAFKTYTDGMGVCKRNNEQHARSELAGARLELGDEEDFV